LSGLIFVHASNRNGHYEEEIVARLAIALTGAVCFLTTSPGFAQDAEIVPGQIRAGVERALPPVQRGFKTFGERKTMPLVEVMPALPVAYRKAGCISCHHEGFGLTTLSFLRRKGFAIDEALANQQATTLHPAYEQFAPLYGRR
jgi:hypothetical protein